jgi:hypothetical protein
MGLATILITFSNNAIGSIDFCTKKDPAETGSKGNCLSAFKEKKIT